MHTRVLACALLLSQSGVARADCAANPELKVYYKPDTLPDKSKPGFTRCDVADGKCSKIALKGWLYTQPLKVSKVGKVVASKWPVLRKSERPPLLIFNHGSEEMATGSGDKCDVATYFRDLGFVVFVPHRRGHGKSTGVYLDEYATTYCDVAKNAEAREAKCKFEYLEKQINDVEEAINYVKGLKGKDGKALVDSSRIVISGISFGGIVTMLSNTKDMGQSVAINGAGASQSWESETFRDGMKKATKAAVKPIYFVEPMNDHYIDPTLELSRIAGQNCKQFQATIFPPVDTNNDGKITKADYVGDLDGDGKDFDPRDIAHGTFMTKMPDVWGPSAIEFINRYFDTPAQPFDSLCKGTSSGPIEL